MIKLRDAARQALAIFEREAGTRWVGNDEMAALLALREALVEQAEQEPVGNNDWKRVSYIRETLNAEQAQQEPVALPFNCWSTNDGDSWYEHPADAQLIYDTLGDDAKVGDEFEVTAGWTCVTARYRIVSQDGDDFEVECISHPKDNAAPVRTKDLTDDEINALIDKSWIELMTIKEFARAVIAADREKNK